MKIVLDTNVYMEARFDKKKKKAPRRIVEECSQGRVTLVYTPAIAEEVLRVLQSACASDVFLAKAYHTFAHGEELSDVAELGLCADPSDNKFIDCAVAGNADYLISHDKHVRDLDDHNGLRVRTASEFYQEISSAHPPPSK